MENTLIRELRNKYTESYIEYEYTITSCYLVMKLDKTIMRPVLENGVGLTFFEKIEALSGIKNIKKTVADLLNNVTKSIIDDLKVDNDKMHKMTEYLDKAFYQKAWKETVTFSDFFEKNLLANHRKIRNILFHKLALNKNEENNLSELIKNVLPIDEANNRLVRLSMAKLSFFLEFVPEAKVVFEKNEYLSWIMSHHPKLNK